MAVTTPSRTSLLISFVGDPVFLSAFMSWAFAQVTKAMVVLVRNRRRWNREVLLTLLWKTGGMPSSHSSLVTALAISVGFKDGIDSSVFIVALCLALIVIRDSLGVRRSSGIQARTLNSIGRELAQKYGYGYNPVKEVQGHSPLEVMVGALMGVFIAVGFSVL